MSNKTCNLLIYYCFINPIKKEKYIFTFTHQTKKNIILYSYRIKIIYKYNKYKYNLYNKKYLKFIIQ